MMKAANRRKWQFAALFVCRENICFRGQFFLQSAPTLQAIFAAVSVHEIGFTLLQTLGFIRLLHARSDRQVGNPEHHRSCPVHPQANA